MIQFEIFKNGFIAKASVRELREFWKNEKSTKTIKN